MSSKIVLRWSKAKSGVPLAVNLNPPDDPDREVTIRFPVDELKIAARAFVAAELSYKDVAFYIEEDSA